MKPWFLKYPRRLEEELRALGEAGFSFEVDERAKQAGRIVIRVKYPLDGQIHQITAIFPEVYPYVPFEILCPTFPDGRHKRPTDGNLCFLKDPQKSWRAQDDRLAEVLATQLPKIAVAHRKPDDAGELEAQEAAQVTGYYPYAPDSVVFTGDWGIPTDCKRGYLVLGVSDSIADGILRSAVLEVQDENRQTLATIDHRIRKRYGGTAKGRWVRMTSFPSFNPLNALGEATKLWGELRAPRFDGAPDVVGILFPEEVQYKQFKDNWIFVVRQKTRQQRKHAQAELINYFARADQVSEGALLARMANLWPLRQKKMLVVGLGSIGSLYAWEMARAGIKSIKMVDFDHLQFGNSSRWLLGWPSAGHDKATLLTRYLSNHYPLSSFEAVSLRIGTASDASAPSESKALEDALDGVDLIFDATAEWCISHLLSDLGREHNIPYLWATGTSGARGGTIGRVIPGRTAGCWKCYQRHMTDGTISIPNQSGLPDVQPAGCFHATFSGTGFDMDHITLAAVRLSASTLCVGFDGAYPDFDWDVAVINTWSAQGMPIAPEWTIRRLERHPGCEEHGD